MPNIYQEIESERGNFAVEIYYMRGGKEGRENSSAQERNFCSALIERIILTMGVGVSFPLPMV